MFSRFCRKTWDNKCYKWCYWNGCSCYGSQIGGYVVGPWASLTDKYIQNALGEDGLGKTAEEVYDLMLRATVGRIGSEALLGGDE